MEKYTISKEYLEKVLNERSKVLVGVCMKRFEILQNKDQIKNDVKELIYEHYRYLKDLIVSYNSGMKFVVPSKERSDEKTKEKEMAKKALQALEELEELEKLDDIVKQDVIEFEVDKTTYRVSRLNPQKQKELMEFRRHAYMELVDDKTYLFRKQWIDKYKAKGIDIDKMDVDIKGLQNKVEASMLRLAKTESLPDIDTLKKEIVKLRNKQYDISIEKTSLLSYSIEDQLYIKAGTYSTYLVLERKEKEKWVPVYKTYKEFEESEDGEVINTAVYYMGYLSVPSELKQDD